jgi:hypothetical protein
MAIQGCVDTLISRRILVLIALWQSPLSSAYTGGLEDFRLAGQVRELVSKLDSIKAIF